MRSILFLLLVPFYLFSADYEIVVESSNPDVNNKILNGLEDFNKKFYEQKYGAFEITPFVIYAKDTQSEVIGGLCGYFFEGSSTAWAYVDYAWVDESRRHQGIGTKLFQTAETVAKSKQCTHIQLFTWEYQAVDFYKKLGFECVGIVPRWIDDYDAMFFKKRLL